MTYASNTDSVSPKSFGLASALRGLVARVVGYRRYSATLRQLNALTDRELADIGLNRGALPSVARQSMHVAR